MSRNSPTSAKRQCAARGPAPKRRRPVGWHILFSLLPIIGLCRCVQEPTPNAAIRPHRLPPSSSYTPYTINKYKLDLALNPKLHRLEASAELTVIPEANSPTDRLAPRRVNGKLRLRLHRDLGIDTITTAGRPVPFRKLPLEEKPKTPAEDDADLEDPSPPPAVYELDLPDPLTRGTVLILQYGGLLFQDVSAGEKPGEIHNFQMQAHISPEGIYLAPNGVWYPQTPEPDHDNGAAPAREIQTASFQLSIADIPDMLLVACGNRDKGCTDGITHKSTWRTPFPIDGMALVGGPLEDHYRRVGDVRVRVLLHKDHARFAKGLLDAVQSYLKLYQPLLGNYPYKEFAVVENFFSSGFAYPGFTLLSSTVISMGKMGLRPDYLDHELLHNWWGNGVFVSQRDGNWCECLTSYCANYMRPVLQGDARKARAQRRDICYGLSLIVPDKDKPLGRFEQKNGPGRFIGYQKGSMVFAMLSQQIGPDVLWKALKQLYQQRLGRVTDWNDIQRIIERQSGRSLERFFNDWVRGRGVPDIRIDQAHYDPRALRLTITTLQKGPHVFDVRLPIRLVFDNGTQDETIPVNRPAQVSVIRSLDAPKFIEVDPDFHLMRKIPLEDVMPTISGIGKSKPLAIVTAENDFQEYNTVAKALRRRYKDADDSAVKEIKAADLMSDDLKKGHALLLGKACLTPAARRLLKGRPLTFSVDAFTVDGKRYDRPGDAVLCCLRNKNDPGGVICFYDGNGAKALKKASLITFYGGNSLIVFRNGTPIHRLDFEQPQRIPVAIGP